MSDVSAFQAGTVKIGDLYVNRIGFGAMRITGPGAWGSDGDSAEVLALLRAAVAADITFIDTADAYGPKISEQYIADALYPYDGIVIGTKGGLTRPDAQTWAPNGSTAHLRAACEASLARLKVPRIDLYQLHAVDPAVPFAESFTALLELQAEGKIRHIGLSNITPEQFVEAQRLGTFVSVQNNYNVGHREHEAVLKLCEDNGITFIPYFPIGGGGVSLADDTRLQAIAARHGATVPQIALAWLLQHSPVTLPIPGTRSLEHLHENVAAAELTLGGEDIAKLDQLASK